jgi:hypothetical protein
LDQSEETEMTTWSECAQTAIIDEQIRLIEGKHGKEAADMANYGWGTSADNDAVSIATKVYLPDGAVVLVSDAVKGTAITHRWEKYRTPALAPAPRADRE